MNKGGYYNLTPKKAIKHENTLISHSITLFPIKIRHQVSEQEQHENILQYIYKIYNIVYIEY